MVCTQKKIIYYKNWEIVAEKFIYPARQRSISGLKMAELQIKGIIQDELNLNFLLQTVRFENEKTYKSVD